jgi:hypothetical protein
MPVISATSPDWPHARRAPAALLEQSLAILHAAALVEVLAQDGFSRDLKRGLSMMALHSLRERVREATALA